MSQNCLICNTELPDDRLWEVPEGCLCSDNCIDVYWDNGCCKMCEVE